MYISDNEYLDIEKLRDDLRNDALGAFYGGGYGGAFVDSIHIEQASPVELVSMAQERGIDITRYITYLNEEETLDNKVKLF